MLDVAKSSEDASNDREDHVSSAGDIGESAEALALIKRVRWIILFGACVVAAMPAILFVTPSPFAERTLAIVAAALLLAAAGSLDVWRTARLRLRRQEPTRAFRRGWAAVGIGALAASAGAAIAAAPWGGELSVPDDGVLAALAFGIVPIAFVMLVFERGLAVSRFPVRPEALALVGLLRLAALAPVAMAAVAWVGRAWPDLTPRIDIAVAITVFAAAAELALRAGLAVALPAPRSAVAKPIFERLVLASLLSGTPIRVAGRALARDGGIALRRTWASRVAARAAPIIALGTALAGWALTGVIVVKPDQRAVYERFGAPAAVFMPGLHAGLPWPFGRMKLLDYGVVHPISASPAVTGENVVAAEPNQSERAEAAQPFSANRLWDSTHPFDRSHLVAGGGNDRRGLQAVEADIRLFYRVGLSDRAALEWTYGATDVESVVVHEAGQLLLRFFSQRTLDQLLSEKRDVVERELTASLAAQLGDMHCGVEILAVVVEAMHPPPGAANAYHGVQAAEIATQAVVAAQRGHAVEMIAEADRASTAEIAGAHAAAAEATSMAKAGAERFAAEQSAWRAVGRAFTFERYLQALAHSLAEARLIVADHRLSPSDQPVLDMRSNVAPSVETEPILPKPP